MPQGVRKSLASAQALARRGLTPPEGRVNAFGRPGGIDMTTHTEKMKPMAHAPLGATVPVPAPWSAFEAPTAEGAVRLWVHEPVRHAADAALALAACAPLLDALDAWFGFAPAWRWCAPGTPSGGVPPHARAQWHCDDAGAKPVACRIELPWSLLRQLDAPPAPLDKQLHWSAAPAMLVLARLQLDDVELEMLEPGGALLLPCSMTVPWQGWLRAADEGAAVDAGLTVSLSDPWHPQVVPVVERQPPAEQPDGAVYEVRLALPRPLDAAQLAGWQAGTPAEPDTRASLWRCTGDGGSGRYLASGALMPWGDGWALHLETLAD